MHWDEIKESLRCKLPETAFHLWIEKLACSRADSHGVELVCPDRFSCSWITEHYLGLIEESMAEAVGGPVAVRLTVGSEEHRPELLPEKEERQLYLPSMPPVPPFTKTLHPQYTFDQFVVGECNALAYSACTSVANGETSYGGCLYIDAGTGLGKSHLAQAVAHHLRANAPTTRLHFLTAEQFTSEMVRGIKANTMDQLKDKYRNNCDILVLEGTPSLAGKEKTQAELTDTLDVLMEKGKRIIFTGSVPPRKIAGISEGFRSRLCAGLVTSINPPDMETRILIVKRKMRNYRMHLSDDVIGFLADKLRGDIRQVESAVVGLRAKSTLLRQEPDLEIAKEIVLTLVGDEARLTVDTIKSFVSRQYKISESDLQSKSRKKSVAFPRHMAMYLARKLTDQGLAEIGKAFNRDHSTVVHSIRVMSDLIVRDGSVRGQVDLLCQRLRPTGQD